MIRFFDSCIQSKRILASCACIDSMDLASIQPMDAPDYLPSGSTERLDDAKYGVCDPIAISTKHWREL